MLIGWRVYGMLSYSVSARLREIGVHLALGADALASFPPSVEVLDFSDEAVRTPGMSQNSKCDM